MLPPVSFKNWPLDLGIWQGRGDAPLWVLGMKNRLKKAWEKTGREYTEIVGLDCVCQSYFNNYLPKELF